MREWPQHQNSRCLPQASKVGFSDLFSEGKKIKRRRQLLLLNLSLHVQGNSSYRSCPEATVVNQLPLLFGRKVRQPARSVVPGMAARLPLCIVSTSTGRFSPCPALFVKTSLDNRPRERTEQHQSAGAWSIAVRAWLHQVEALVVLE